ncbi:hypothetical protein CAPTEDRAFT_190853 [Capitella teleta]|uniref:Cytochrome b5 n=1 Tax=Capitella teleta TaxID=283909 RepID=R7V791_CAPTE|nr:hypothetical protein CAPTEDRAFT_190853 [Capitella teleta]|eukprot:ELU12236.1 hypothetical protein CAPTEDRAFT_190853 [Capitella teleta]
MASIEGNEQQEDSNEENEVEVKVIRMSDVSVHSEADSCWMVVNDNVYDITQFLREHPGGEDVLLEHGGRDATEPFKEVAHSEDASTTLQRFFIGILHEDDRINKTKKPKTY